MIGLDEQLQQVLVMETRGEISSNETGIWSDLRGIISIVNIHCTWNSINLRENVILQRACTILSQLNDRNPGGGQERPSMFSEQDMSELNFINSSGYMKLLKNKHHRVSTTLSMVTIL